MISALLHPIQRAASCFEKEVVQKHQFTTIALPILSASGYLFKRMVNASGDGDILMANFWYLGLCSFYMATLIPAHHYFQSLESRMHAFPGA